MKRTLGDVPYRDDSGMAPSAGDAPSAGRALTAQQAAALAARETSVSLAAGAGCGKTFVLTERFLAAADRRQGGEGKSLTQLAAITFTDAAAREMRSRIRRTCYQRLQSAATPSEADDWLQLMRDIDGARISTFHSFCATLLRRCAIEADVDPRFELLDQASANLLQIEAVDDLLRERLDARDERLLRLAAESNIEGVRNDLAHLLRETLAAPMERVQSWLAMSAGELADHWQRQFISHAGPIARDEITASDPFRQLTQLADASRALDPRLAEHLSALGGLLRSSESAPIHDRQFFVELFETAKTPQFIRAAKWHDGADHVRYRDACEALRKLLKESLLMQPFDAANAREAAEKSLTYLSLVADARALIDRRKSARRQLEFADLVLGAHRLMTHPDHVGTAQQIAGEIELLMVDEFQDTDPLQVELVQALAPAWQTHGLFVVGDAKQSIYRFRGAAPNVARSLREALSPPSRLALTHNFRSQPAVVDFVNGLFYDAFDEPYEGLSAAKPQASSEPCVEFLWVPASQPEDPQPEDRQPEDPRQEVEADKKKKVPRTKAKAPPVRDARLVEAAWIARRLRQLFRDQTVRVADASAAGGVRNVRPGDVALLFRSMTDVPLYEEALRGHGIDYHLAGGHTFYAQQEVYDMLNLLRAVASEIDETSLAGALRSPFFALTDESLFWLVETHGSLHAALAAGSPPKQLDAREAAKFLRAVATLAWLREAKDRLLTAELLTAALARTGYDAALQAEFLGDRKLANLEKLIEQARRLDRTSPGDLPGYIAQLSEFVARPPKEALAATQAEGDVVRLMTIHNAKGLEFPLVVVSDLDRNEHASRSRLAFDEQLGPILRGRNEEALTGWDVYRARERRQESEERKRLFYVACTRAADYLILSTSSADLQRPKSEAMKLLADRFDLATGAYHGPAPPGLLCAEPQVRVVDEEPPLGDGPTFEPRRGVDLLKIVEKTRQVADKLGGDAQGELPPAALRWEGAGRFRRHFSFSRLSGALALVADADEAGHEASDADFHDPHAAGRDDGDPMAGGPDGGRPGGARPASTAANRLAPEPPLANARPDPRTLGTLVHAVLERYDFGSGANVSEACRRAGEASMIDGPTLEAAVQLVTRFVESERAAELAAAQRIVRETEFLLAWPLAGETGAPRYLQGVMDCLYLDAQGDWHLIDYKTNRITAGQAPQAAKAYELQMFVYSEACRRALGVDPVETTLCFLFAGVERRIEWTAARRRSASVQLTRALQRVISGNLSA